MRIRDGVDAFGLEWSYDEPLSVHVIETDEATVLFGGGIDDAAGELVDVARERGVDAVIVEHGDLDHYGGVPALRESLDVEVAVPAGDAGFLEDEGIEPDVRLEAGVAFRGVEPIAAPGHTPDNMAYRYGDVLVAGDTVMGSDSYFAADEAWSGPLAVASTSSNADDAEARRSVRNLLEYDFEVVLVTHGSNVLEDGREAVETLVDDLGV